MLSTAGRPAARAACTVLPAPCCLYRAAYTGRHTPNGATLTHNPPPASDQVGVGDGEGDGDGPDDGLGDGVGPGGCPGMVGAGLGDGDELGEGCPLPDCLGVGAPERPGDGLPGTRAPG